VNVRQLDALHIVTLTVQFAGAADESQTGRVDPRQILLERQGAGVIEDGLAGAQDRETGPGRRER
jgi:hypothetical protein